MATFGKIEEYQETEDWRNYVKRLDHYFEANDIKSNDKQKAIFLATVGAKTYNLIRNLVPPDQKKDKTTSQSLQEFYKHRPSVIVQRFKFNTRNQRKLGSPFLNL
jgi:DNA gyrase/topoisomerase IV subunit A